MGNAARARDLVGLLAHGGGAGGGHGGVESAGVAWGMAVAGILLQGMSVICSAATRVADPAQHRDRQEMSK